MNDAERAVEETRSDRDYVLDDQVGFILRQVNQRHTGLFVESFGDTLTSMQWAAMAKLYEKGPVSQNLLGRLTAMDVATIKGVIDRLTKRGFIETRSDETDGRRHFIALTRKGHEQVVSSIRTAFDITEKTLAPLTKSERSTFLQLLKKMR